MSNMIPKPGLYQMFNKKQAEVLAEREGRWFGRYQKHGTWKPGAWDADGQGDYLGMQVVGPWPAFSVGGTVLVNCVASPFHQHYGEVYEVSNDRVSVLFSPDPFTRPFMECELKPVTLPLPVPEGWRLKPRNVRPVEGVDKGVDKGVDNTRDEWSVVAAGWARRTAEEWDREQPRFAPYFFIEPISPAIPEPPEPPEGFVVMPKDYVAVSDADRVWIKGKWEVVNFFGGRTESQLDEQYAYQGKHYIASPIPTPAVDVGEQPFRISTNGPGVYLTRGGREAHVRILTGDDCNQWWAQWPDASCKWPDNGRCFRNKEVDYDLVRYLRPLPQPEPQPTGFTCTNELRDRILNRDSGGPLPEGTTHRVVNGKWAFVVSEQRWTNGTDVEWRPVPVETGD